MAADYLDEAIAEAVEDAKRFLRAVDRRAAQQKVNQDALRRCEKEHPGKTFYESGTPMENGAVKRASLDLTRSLARIRK